MKTYLIYLITWRDANHELNVICANRKTPQLMLLWRTTLKIKVLHHPHIITATTHLERYCAFCDITKGWTQELCFWTDLLEIRASGRHPKSDFSHFEKFSVKLEMYIIAGKHFRVNRNEYRATLVWILVIKSTQDSNGEQKCWRILYHDYVITHYLTVVKQSGFPPDSFSADSGIIKDINTWIKVLRARRRGASGALPQAPSVESIRKRPQTAACWCNTGPSYCFGFYSALYSSLIFSWWLHSR